MGAKSLWKRKFVKVFRQFENKRIRFYASQAQARGRISSSFSLFVSVPRGVFFVQTLPALVNFSCLFLFL